MCRMVVFAGTCTRCEESQTWDDLTQRLSCLEAKNQDSFGSCTAGVFIENHNFDQECDRCAEEDEGIGDVGDEHGLEAVTGKRSAADDESEEAEFVQSFARDSKKQKT
jgi:hypothetical protein